MREKPELRVIIPASKRINPEPKTTVPETLASVPELEDKAYQGLHDTRWQQERPNPLHAHRNVAG